jgi:DNA invertase Pin-like site-specific DNA recombinase
MKTAYLYVRVSTDEQKRTGFSLIEQEDRLMKHCELHDIHVNGIFREDYSAKDFNRPEWKKLIAVIRKNKHRPPENILFIKWDRFSRNIEYAYQMMRILTNLNVNAMAIDQPIDFDIPESIVMLAVYLSIPEAENSRRGRNSADGMRRSKKLGRWPARAPFGYVNKIGLDGKKIIIPTQPEADIVKLSFELYAKGKYSVWQVKEMAAIKGIRCSRSNLWRLFHNPLYCGMITIPANKEEGVQYVNGIHEPLISEELFQNVQILLKSKRKLKNATEDLRVLFPLRGLIFCPHCEGKLSGSRSSGGQKKYGYYHCTTSKCKGRFRSDALNENYEKQLERIVIKPAVCELFNMVLEDENIFTVRKEYTNERKATLVEIAQYESLISKARKHFLNDQIDYEDFRDLRKDYKEILDGLGMRLSDVTHRISFCDIQQYCDWSTNRQHIIEFYRNTDIVGKRRLINLLVPTTIIPATTELNPLKIHSAISNIVEYV